MTRPVTTVCIADKEYPCRELLLAWMLFKRKTGKEVTEIDFTSPSDLGVYLWACTAAACKADGVEFSYDLDTFAALVTPQTLYAWAAGTLVPQTGEEEEAETSGDKKK